MTSRLCFKRSWLWSWCISTTWKDRPHKYTYNQSLHTSFSDVNTYIYQTMSCRWSASSCSRLTMTSSTTSTRLTIFGRLHHTYIHIHTVYIHTYIHMFLHTLHTNIYAYIYSKYIHLYIHMYLHACIHTYIHTYIHSKNSTLTPTN